MPAFTSLSYREAQRRADKCSIPAFVYHVWDTDTQPGGGFDWCTEREYYQSLPEVREHDIVYSTVEGVYD